MVDCGTLSRINGNSTTIFVNPDFKLCGASPSPVIRFSHHHKPGTKFGPLVDTERHFHPTASRDRCNIIKHATNESFRRYSRIVVALRGLLRPKLSSAVNQRSGVAIRELDLDPETLVDGANHIQAKLRLDVYASLVTLRRCDRTLGYPQVPTVNVCALFINLVAGHATDHPC